MRTFIILFTLTFMSLSTFAHEGGQQAPPVPDSAPTAVKMVQRNMNYVDHLVIFKYINPLKTDLHLKIYGPQGYLIHVEDLSSGDSQRIGFSLDGMADGEYRVVLQIGKISSDQVKVFSALLIAHLSL